MNGRKRILAVEDDPELAELYRSILGDEGYEVTVAGDAREGLRLMASHPDVILLDLVLPGPDGYSLLRRMREQRELDDLPVVVVSASVPPGRERIAGAQAIVRKPFDFAGLLLAIERVQHQPPIAR